MLPEAVPAHAHVRPESPCQPSAFVPEFRTRRKTPCDSVRMAHPKGEDMGETPTDDLLVDRFVDESPHGAEDDSRSDADDAASLGAESEAASLLPAPLRRIELKLDWLVEQFGGAPAGGGRSGATLGGVAGTATVPAALVDDLRLAKSNLAGLSERVESLERRLSERFKPIDEAVQSVRVTTQALAATGKMLEGSARSRLGAGAGADHRRRNRYTQAVCVPVGCGHSRCRARVHRAGARPAARVAVARFKRECPARRVRADRTPAHGAPRVGP